MTIAGVQFASMTCHAPRGSAGRPPLECGLRARLGRGPYRRSNNEQVVEACDHHVELPSSFQSVTTEVAVSNRTTRAHLHLPSTGWPVAKTHLTVIDSRCFCERRQNPGGLRQAMSIGRKTFSSADLFSRRIIEVAPGGSDDQVLASVAVPIDQLDRGRHAHAFEQVQIDVQSVVLQIALKDKTPFTGCREIAIPAENLAVLGCRIRSRTPSPSMSSKYIDPTG